MVILRSVALAAALALAGAANAHVSLAPSAAVAGSYQVLRFGVGHGCDNKPTTGLRIEIPPSVAMAHPQPKPGWTLSVEHAPDKDAVAAIVWQGQLSTDQFDEFLVMAKLPSDAQSLAFPAVQSCGTEEIRWIETPEPGGPRPQHPAPVLILTPGAAPADAGHEHHH